MFESALLEHRLDRETFRREEPALRELGLGKTVRKGDVVSYIIAAGEGAPVSDPPPKRAYAPYHLLKPDSGLAPDVEWYIGKQIFPPVERLCANVPGTSTAQLAENLGLDVRRYSSNNAGGDGAAAVDLEVHPPGSGPVDPAPWLAERGLL